MSKDFSEHTLTDLAVNLEAVQTRIRRVKTDMERLSDWEAEEAELSAEIFKRIGKPPADSTETVESDRVVIAEGGEVQWTEAVAEEIDAALNSEPAQPMADLSGVDHSPAFEGYQPNGSLPETD